MRLISALFLITFTSTAIANSECQTFCNSVLTCHEVAQDASQLKDLHKGCADYPGLNCYSEDNFVSRACQLYAETCHCDQLAEFNEADINQLKQDHYCKNSLTTACGISAEQAQEQAQ